MKKYLLTSCLVAAAFVFMALQNGGSPVINYDYKIVTTIESVVPGGLGRSRLLVTDDNKQVQEKDLENFFSLVGINFKNVANNDRVIADKLSEMNKDGWEFFNLTTGVYGEEKSTGIFITRYFFRKTKK